MDAALVPPDLVLCDFDADARFRAAVVARGANPDDPWIGGYAPYQWQRMRPIWETTMGTAYGGSVLEFGCNYGATAIVLATLGVRVTAIDVDTGLVRLAKLNAARYGVAGQIAFVGGYDGVRLPFASSIFDAVVCSGVLEYVAWSALARVQREIDRVLKPGGTLIVCGTSNRLWPREMHSGRWLVNYSRAGSIGSPDANSSAEYGPWTIRYGFGRYENLDWSDRGAAYTAARLGTPEGVERRAIAVAARCLRPFGVTPGLLTPSLSITLRKGVRRRS
jgi:SAM-dependent methyltransferase